MTSQRRIRKSLLALSALMLASQMIALPTAVSATTDDGLAQILDPNQAQGTGQVVLDRGHADFGPTLNTGEWIIQIHDDTASPSYWRHLEDVVLKVNDEALLRVPEDEAYRFLGQEPGTEVWVVPQTRKPDVVWAGWNTQEPNVLESLKLGTTLSVLNIEGPGEVIAYLQSGNFGDPEPLWSSLEPFPQHSWIEVNTHTHANWVFTEPGIYLVEVQFAAELIGGESVSARDTLRFAVGDSTDPQPAFGMSIIEQVDESAAAGGAAVDDVGEAAVHEQTDSNLGVIVWAVVGAIALVLLLAIVLIAAASRRAKARAIAARAAKEPQA